MKNEIEKIEKKLGDLRNSVDSQIGNIKAQLSGLKQSNMLENIQYKRGDIVRCVVANDTCFTEGKVYKIEDDGAIIDNNGNCFAPLSGEITGVEWLERNGFKFECIVKHSSADEPKYFTGDVVFIGLGVSFTNGKMYHFKNGRVADNDGDLWGNNDERIDSQSPYKSIEEWNKRYPYYKFRLAVESDYVKPSEPVWLWCAKDDRAGYWITRGKLYNLDEFKTDVVESEKHRGISYTSYESFIQKHPDWRDKLFPLEKRPAKEGEWFRINVNDPKIPDIHIGAIHKAEYCDSDFVYFKDRRYHLKINEYEVIDGYNGEYEIESKELLQGTFVCLMSNNSNIMIQYKKYIFKDGKFEAEYGANSNTYKTVEEFNSRNKDDLKIAPLIEE